AAPDPQFFPTPPLPSYSQNMVIFRPPCGTAASPITNPTLDDAPACNAGLQLSIVTSSFGAQVDTILGDTDDAVFRVSAAAASVQTETFVLGSLGSRRYGTGDYHAPVMQMTLLQLVNDKGQLLNGAAAGTVFPRPMAVSLTIAEDNYVIEPLPSCTPAGECYKVKSLETTRVRQIDVHKPG